MAESEEPELANRESLDNFDRAFSHIRTGCFKCECGKVYWDNQNGGYDWNDGELEALEKNPNATAVPYAIDVIDIDGREYANACNCWEKRASRIIGWLENNRTEIAAYFRYEKERKMAEANRLATIE